MCFLQNEKPFVMLWLLIRLLIFMRLTAERNNLMRLSSWSIPYTSPPNVQPRDNILITKADKIISRFYGTPQNLLNNIIKGFQSPNTIKEKVADANTHKALEPHFYLQPKIYKEGKYLDLLIAQRQLYVCIQISASNHL